MILLSFVGGVIFGVVLVIAAIVWYVWRMI